MANASSCDFCYRGFVNACIDKYAGRGHCHPACAASTSAHAHDTFGLIVCQAGSFFLLLCQLNVKSLCLCSTCLKVLVGQYSKVNSSPGCMSFLALNPMNGNAIFAPPNTKGNMATLLSQL